MQTIFVLILILVLGYTGAHLLFYKSRFPLGTRYILSAGSEHLLLGLLLGTAPLAILTPEIIQLLSPAVNLGLGWVGLLFGLQFEWAQLRRISLRFMRITLIQAVITFLLVLAGIGLITSMRRDYLAVEGLLLLAAIASVSSPTCLAFMRTYYSFPHFTRRLAHYISSLDAVVGLIILGLFQVGRRYPVWFNLPLYLILAACLIAIFHLLTRLRINRQEMLILTIGMVMFSSGLAGALGFSALLLNFLLGVGLINLPSHNHRQFADILHRQEKPIYLIFLVLAGAMWTPTATPLFILTAYLIFRFLGKIAGSCLAGKLSHVDFALPRFWGVALLPQGGMGIAMAVDYLQSHPGGTGSTILNIILAATLISQMLGPVAVRRGLSGRITV